MANSNVCEFCISKKLLLDFEASLPYNRFDEAVAWQNLFDSEVSIMYEDERANSLNENLEWLQERECLDSFRKDGGKTVTSLKNIMIFFILKQCVFRAGNKIMQKEIGDLLRGDVNECYYSNDKGCQKIIDLLQLMHDTDFSEFNMNSVSIKYRNAKGKWWLIEPYEQFPIPLNKIDLGCFKVVKYDEYIERNNLFDYVLFSIIALHKKLYLVYGNGFNPIIGIVEKSRLDEYLFGGAFVVDISSIVKQIFCSVLNGSYLEKTVSIADKHEKEREKFYSDLRNDAGDKHKITVNATVEYGIPTFMSVQFKDSNMNNYKELEKWIGDNGEISKKKGLGKYNAITAKKQHVYGDKNDIKLLKNMKKK